MNIFMLWLVSFGLNSIENKTVHFLIILFRLYRHFIDNKFIELIRMLMIAVIVDNLIEVVDFLHWT